MGAATMALEDAATTETAAGGMATGIGIGVEDSATFRSGAAHMLRARR